MLGKGLESLIPPSEGFSKKPEESEEFKEEEISEKSENSDFSEISIQPEKPPAFQAEKEKLVQSEAVYLVETEKIKPNPFQPRRTFKEGDLKELADSIREFGILQPLIVSKRIIRTEFGGEDEYVLIAGERRLMAAKLLGLERVPVIIKEIKEDKSRLEMAVIENLQRRDLNPIETARAFARLADEFNMSQREIAIRIGKSREVVANTLRLLQLPSQIQKALEEGEISESHARAILTFNSPDQQIKLFEEIVKYNLSVKEANEKAKEMAKGILSEFSFERKERKKISQKREIDPILLETARFLEEFLSTPVEISPKGKESGKISIRFFDRDHLKSIIEKITGKEEHS